MADSSGADFADDRPAPGCLELGLKVFLLFVAAASLGYAFILGLGPISIFGLPGVGPSMAVPIAVGAAATVALLLVGHSRPRGRS